MLAPAYPPSMRLSACTSACAWAWARNTASFSRLQKLDDWHERTQADKVIVAGAIHGPSARRGCHAMRVGLAAQR